MTDCRLVLGLLDQEVNQNCRIESFTEETESAPPLPSRLTTPPYAPTPPVGATVSMWSSPELELS